MGGSLVREASDTTVARWGKRQAGVLLVIASFGAAGVIQVTSSGGNPALVAAFFAPFVIAIGYFVFLRYRSATDHSSAGVLWVGYGEFDLAALRDAHLADSITLRSQRRLDWWTLGRGVVGGRLIVLAEEMVFSLGNVARVAGASGTVHIPRSRIEDLQVGHVPGTAVSKSGGGVSVQLSDGYRLDGRFLGSKPMLLEALKTWG